MRKWRDPEILVVIMAAIITSIAAPILVPEIRTWIETQSHNQKPMDKGFGNVTGGNVLPPREPNDLGKVTGGNVQGEPLCNKSYPDFCIKGDVDCSDISARNFTVKQPDPMHFDTDGDGRGCEE